MKSALLFTILSFFTSLTVASSASTNDRKTYIVHMNASSMPLTFTTHESWHASILTSLSATHLYSYSHVLHGFSASLSSSQLKALQQMPEHITAFPDKYGTLHTTHTPKFLGLSHQSGIWPVSNYGSGVIIGVIDTGVWPESKSFLDKGMGSVPSRWKGKCEESADFPSTLCNRKLIGARSFSKGIRNLGYNISTTDDYDSPRDFLGHGTHTSSTAASSPVRDASYFGYAQGTMTGIAPKAHVAMYKALFYDSENYGAASDVLAAMDQAIEDGVDVMSISLGFGQAPFYEDMMAIGAFAAMQKGIFVSASAGNSGPEPYTVINSAPWFMSVGAGTMDRDYTATVSIGDGASRIQFTGRSFYPQNLYVSNSSFYNGNECSYLNPKEVAGKFVFCYPGFNTTLISLMSVLRESGAEGMIFVTDAVGLLSSRYFNKPNVAVGPKEGKEIKEYIINAKGRLAIDIKFIQTVLGTKPAPQVIPFSSRGPGSITPGIMKPDILAPGVNVLASWVPNKGFTLLGDNYLLSDYALISGTSMAAPHIAGVAALLKSAYPDWSPAAVRSAMMTTADIVDNTGGTIVDMNVSSAGTPLDFGAGLVNPNRAMDPGLVYDIGYEDYVKFVCGLNYTEYQRAAITKNPYYNCDNFNLDLNYPSFMVIVGNRTKVASQVFTRILTSVVDYPANYKMTVYEPNGMKITVQPSRLYFEGKGSKAGYSLRVDVDLSMDVDEKNEYKGNYGFISWNEIGGRHEVRSPVVSAFGPPLFKTAWSSHMCIRKLNCFFDKMLKQRNLLVELLFNI